MQTSPPQLTVALTLVLMAGGAVVTGCGGSPTSPSSPTTTARSGDIAGTISANHDRPHVAVITTAQLTLGAAVALDISNGLHSHTVNLTSAQVVQVAAGTRVSVASSMNPHSDGTGAHQHTVTFN